METKKSRKWIWITLVIVVVLVAAALLVWHFVAADKETEAEEETESITESESEEETDEETTASETDCETASESSSCEEAVNEPADTEAPKVTVKDLTAASGVKVSPEDFIVSCEESSEYTVKFENEPDASKARQEVTIVVEDAAGNKTTCTANLTVVTDDTAPEILGAEDITIDLGSDFDPMEGISVKDDFDPDPQIVATTNVNTEKPGEYSVRYKATDASGNNRFVVIKVNVAE